MAFLDCYYTLCDCLGEIIGGALVADRAVARIVADMGLAFFFFLMYYCDLQNIKEGICV